MGGCHLAVRTGLDHTPVCAPAPARAPVREHTEVEGEVEGHLEVEGQDQVEGDAGSRRLLPRRYLAVRLVYLVPTSAAAGPKQHTNEKAPGRLLGAR